MATKVEATSRQLEVNGVRLHYLDWGNESAQPMVLLHGFTGHARSWDALAAALAPHFHVIALDQRGHGDSGWTDDYGMEAMVADVDGLVRQLGLRRFVLLGLSMGGRNAFNYTAMHPEEVERLVIVDIGPEINSHGASRIQAGLREPDVFDSREEAFAQARKANERPPEDHQRYRVFHNLMQRPDGKWTWKYDSRLQTGDPGRVRRPIDAGQQWKNWASIRCPILLLRGELSDVLSPEVAERMTRENRNCNLAVVAGSGHSIPLDRPVEFEAAVREWLGA